MFGYIGVSKYIERIFMKNIFLVALVSLTGLVASAKDQVVEIKSTAEGFVPAKIEVSADEPVILKVTRTVEGTCGTEIVIKDKKVNQKLPLNETVTINLGKLKKGEVKFSCAMNMIKGSLQVK